MLADGDQITVEGLQRLQNYGLRHDGRSVLLEHCSFVAMCAVRGKVSALTRSLRPDYKSGRAIRGRVGLRVV